ncbi:hypothetical protein GOP47_0015338 [Adiantum capillus-veneris]|uniref:F-box domain-containing protein n=1 Tax=Adiantum capillus-veneris TaxID=13818 RepID=A0A9D4ZCK1_ADICA|nr:hypothetical protein GOP47_0015338 [Adiantum capillus-veneris]
MRRPDSKDTGDLIPGLPNCLTLDCILPRLPWHARAVLVATSKGWNHALREPHIYSELTRRAHRTISRKGLVLLHQLSDAETFDCFRAINTKRRLPTPLALSILEDCSSTGSCLNMHGTDNSWTWRRLPPIPAYAPLKGQFVLACTCWTSQPAYGVGGSSGSHIHDPDPNPEVYNVDTEEWELLPRVVMSRSLHYNGVSFIKHANLLVTHGFRTTHRGELVSFLRAYSPVMGTWCDYEGEDEVDNDAHVLENCIVSNRGDAERRASSKLDNVAIGDIVLSTVAQHQIIVIKRVMMK